MRKRTQLRTYTHTVAHMHNHPRIILFPSQIQTYMHTHKRTPVSTHSQNPAAGTCVVHPRTHTNRVVHPRTHTHAYIIFFYLSQAGDAILSVDGQNTAGMSVADVRSLIIGPQGSSVRIILRRASGDGYEVRVRVLCLCLCVCVCVYALMCVMCLHVIARGNSYMNTRTHTHT
jgi:hypothetical protein